MIRVELKEDGISQGLDRLVRALSDLSQPMADIGEGLLHSTNERFKTGTAPDGSPWAPKSPVTLARYADQGTPGLTSPLIGESKTLSTTISVESGRDFVAIGSNAIQSAVMQFGAAQGAFGATGRGGPIPWGDIPARPYLGLSAEDRSMVLDVIDEWLERVAAGGA